MVRVGIVGSRKYGNPLLRHDYEEARGHVDPGDARDVESFVLLLPKNWEIVSGAQPKGVDGFVKMYAEKHDRVYKEFPPDHYPESPSSITICPITNQHIVYGSVYNDNYYKIRNARIAAYCDFVSAFVVKGVESRGTMNTVANARNFGRPVHIFESGNYTEAEARHVVEQWVSSS